MLLEVNDLVKHFEGARNLRDTARRRPGAPIRAVDGVSFTVERHEMVALVGESGCGKTTTAQTVLRLLEPTSGTIVFDGRDITKLGQRQMRPLRKRMQVVYQDPYESLSPRYRVRQIVEEPLKIHGIGASEKERQQLVSDGLSRVELNPPARFLDRYPHELSGGQRQRVAIAAALVINPELLIADEPVSMLDVSVRVGVMALLKRLCNEGMGVLMITHDLPLAAHFADRIAVLYLGRIVEVGRATEVLREPQHPYTRALREVAPRLRGDPGEPRGQILGGEPASAAAIPSGCRFHPRCPVAQPRCATTDVQLRQATDGSEGHEAACVLVGSPESAGVSS
jgi:oligopeptide/dipeptide ABC transporter ATP-binding protein